MSICPFSKVPYTKYNFPPGYTDSPYTFRCLLPCAAPLFLYLVGRKPGDIEGITDIFFEDFKNFPQVRELGEDSARFVREEMEKTWGDARMAVLPEDEAQKWILGVILHIDLRFTVSHLSLNLFVTSLTLPLLSYRPLGSSVSPLNWSTKLPRSRRRPSNIYL